MAAGTIRFYLDENLPVEIARQLRLRSIDALTVRDLHQLGDSDLNHLSRATALGRVLCTCDTDFVALGVASRSHTGIIVGQQEIHHIGAWVRSLELIHAVYSPDDMLNHIEYL